MDITSTIVSLRGASAFSEPDDMTEGDNDADEALAECAEAASYPSWAMTADDRSILFGRAAAPDGTLKTHPLEDMTDYQIMRVRAWHDRAARALPLTTRFKLVASYVATRDRDLPETIRLCNIARRAGVRSELRVATLAVFSLWYPDGVQALELLTRDEPTYPETIQAFAAEIRAIKALIK